MTGLRWALTLMLVTNTIVAAYAGFGSFDPGRQALADFTCKLFLLAAIGSAATLAAVELFVELGEG